jgi:selenocysteine-specific elongation factor
MASAPRNFVLATAGHVDHGKSSLVKALTGTDPDRLPEEKNRGITIDLGFAHLALPGADAQTSGVSVGIVDVPGHEDFVKNMVAGVGAIDLALFVVAADDGWMPQTEEHLQILAYLGVEHGVVALTKTDLVENCTEVAAHVRARLAGSQFAHAPIIPTSTLDGRGVDGLKSALAQIVNQISCAPDIGKPRLAVDRVFLLRGVGTVVTGTLRGGRLARGQSVIIQPRGHSAKIRAVHCYGREVESSPPGTRTALNLPDLEAGTGVCRGDVVTLAEFTPPADTIDVRLERSARLPQLRTDHAHATGGLPPADGTTGVARPLKDGALVRVHHGAANVPARVVLANLAALLPGQSGMARLHLQSPGLWFIGDRFIIRDWQEQATLAGGVVLDLETRGRRAWRSGPQQAFLVRAATAGHRIQCRDVLQALLEREGVVPRAQLLLRSNWSQAEIAAAAADLAASGLAVAPGTWLAWATWWRDLINACGAAIDAFHSQHPEHAGLPITQLRALIEARCPQAELFEALARQLSSSGFVQTGTAIRRAAFRPALPPTLRGAGDRLRSALALKPLEPPSRKELAPDSAAQKALRFLIETGEVVELSDDIVLGLDAFARAKAAIAAFLAARGAATASEIRQTLATSRRILIPLLERLDRDGLTQRQGDVRRLRTP